MAGSHIRPPRKARSCTRTPDQVRWDFVRRWLSVAERDLQVAQVIVVDITDFISPTIVERLHAEAGVLQPKIDDWRAMVDCVMIDADYDGRVFRITLSDVPERKTDLVGGRYELPADRVGDVVAVKIIDMLGEEVLVTLPVDSRKDR